MHSWGARGRAWGSVLRVDFCLLYCFFEVALRYLSFFTSTGFWVVYNG